jgi:uncharacterized membrane protein
MKRFGPIPICAAVFSLVGLVTGYLAIENLPAQMSSSQRTDLVLLLALGSPLGGAALGIVVGIFAAIFGPHALPPEEDAGNRAVTQPYSRK